MATQTTRSRREDDPLRCHKCRSADLILREVCHEIGEWAGGLYVSGDGKIRAHGEANFTPGAIGAIQPQRTEIECQECGHIWHPRRWFAGCD